MRVATSTAQSTLYFLSSDHLGSSSLTTDAGGNVVARQLYDAWGNIRSGGGLPTDIGYTSQRLDSGTNLLFMHARYYDSQIGRWSSPDSIIADESNPQSLNRYSYVNNGPLNHTDPTGHMMSCSETSDIRGGCGNDDFHPGKAQEIANGKHQYYAQCQQTSGQGCSSLATAIMNTKDAVDSVSEAVGKVFNNGFGLHIGGCAGGDFGFGSEGCISIQIIVNLHSGQVGIFVSESSSAKVAIPNGLSLSATGGPVLAPGVSDLKQLAGPSDVLGADLRGDTTATVGISAQRSLNLELYDSNGDGISDAMRPLMDRTTGMPVTTLSAGPQVGLNQIPTIIDGSIKSGVSRTQGCLYDLTFGFWCSPVP